MVMEPDSELDSWNCRSIVVRTPPKYANEHIRVAIMAVQCAVNNFGLTQHWMHDGAHVPQPQDVSGSPTIRRFGSSSGMASPFWCLTGLLSLSLLAMLKFFGDWKENARKKSAMSEYKFRDNVIMLVNSFRFIMLSYQQGNCVNLDGSDKNLPTVVSTIGIVY